jgi:large subunit ribosomal protein L15
MAITANNRKKNSRQRASTTHGYGSMKKHRGAGSRGGRGNAGSGKRGDARKPYFRVTEKRELGRTGFKNKQVIDFKPVNIFLIENSCDRLVVEKRATESKGIITLNLGTLGYNKLLGTGKAKRKYAITVDYASASAIAKIEAAGGSVTVRYENGVVGNKKADESEEESEDVAADEE